MALSPGKDGLVKSNDQVTRRSSFDVGVFFDSIPAAMTLKPSGTLTLIFEVKRSEVYPLTGNQREG